MFKLFFVLKILIGIFSVFLYVLPSDASPVHETLVHCYRGNNTQPVFPQTLQILIELIRKIENTYPSALDIRTLSTLLTHRLRIDGIQRAPGVRETDDVTPYRAKGLMSPKFELVLGMVSNVSSNIELRKALTDTEICQLHRILSSSVDPWERGDENRVCPAQRISVDDHTTERPDPFNTTRHLHHNHHPRVSYSSRQQSRCPIETGVIRTFDYGSFSPGTVIASIAAGLQPQNVRMNELVQYDFKQTPWDNLETMKVRDTEKIVRNELKTLDTLDNTYSAGLAGDLAEICVYQGPYFKTNTLIGMPGQWNDTYLPRVRYLSPSRDQRWEMTDAEILAGIDAMFISQQISSWISHTKRLRLSQVLDMFYSSRGVPILAVETTNKEHRTRKKVEQHYRFRKPLQRHYSNNRYAERIENLVPFEGEYNAKLRAMFDRSDVDLRTNRKIKRLNRFTVVDGITNACQRDKILEIIDKTKLKDETYLLSQVLQFSTSSLPVSDDQLRNNCDAAVDRFFNYSESLLRSLPDCQDISKKFIKPALDLALIVDGTRTNFENLQLVSFVAEKIDVSNYGSYLTVIHGSNGARIVNRTQSVARAFEQLQNFSTSDLNTFSLSSSLATYLEMLSNQTIQERRRGSLVDLPHVLLIATQSHLIRQNDFGNARRSIQRLVQLFPDLYIIFITNSIETAEDLMYGTQSWGMEQNDQYFIINIRTLQIPYIERPLTELLEKIPKRIFSPYCKSHLARPSIYDDFVFKEYYEDYLSLNQTLRYRISPYYLYDTEDVRIQFQGKSYGNFTVCMSRNEHKFENSDCQTVADLNIAGFFLDKPCTVSLVCDPVYFTVTMDNSLVKCSDNECRYPDQIKFVIRQDNLRCDRYDGSSALNLTVNFYIIFVSFVIKYLFLSSLF